MAAKRPPGATPRPPPRKPPAAPNSSPGAIQRQRPRRLSPDEVRKLIAEAAYYRAKQRGFAPGHEIEDWIQAEAEVMRRIGGRRSLSLIAAAPDGPAPNGAFRRSATCCAPRVAGACNENLRTEPHRIAADSTTRMCSISGSAACRSSPILDRWAEPPYRYFEVRVDDGRRFVLRHDPATGHWELAAAYGGGRAPLARRRACRGPDR